MELSTGQVPSAWLLLRRPGDIDCIASFVEVDLRHHILSNGGHSSKEAAQLHAVQAGIVVRQE